MTRSLQAKAESWPIAGGFTISRGTKTTADVVVVEVRDGDRVGRGECVPYARYGETVDGVIAAVSAMTGAIANGLTRKDLRMAMAAGAARNALDCALVDLEAKLAGRSAAEILGLTPPVSTITAFTLSLGTPDSMNEAAKAAAARPLIKVKLGGAGDDARIRAVRAGAPNARLIVDANEAWSDDLFAINLTACAEVGVELIEQPLPAGNDAYLATIAHPVPICADESVHTTADLASLTGLYDMVNIKLDKTGGLTEALRMRDRARELGFGVMVGCMVGTSLGMAPAVLLAQDADYVDLDGPLLLARDRSPALEYSQSTVSPPRPDLWG